MRVASDESDGRGAVHSIRLGPPWEVTATAGGARHARKFGRPRTLDAGERAWLVCERVPGAAEVTLNGLPVGETKGPGPFAADVTPLLAPRNEVAFVVKAEDTLGPVRLEVRA